MGPGARQYPLAGAGACGAPHGHRKAAVAGRRQPYKALRDRYDALGGQVELEILAARALIHGLIEKGAEFGDATTLARFETRIDAINDDTRRHLDAENERLLAMLDTGDTKAIEDELQRIDELRDELDQKLDSVRADMLALLRKDANLTIASRIR